MMKQTEQQVNSKDDRLHIVYMLQVNGLRYIGVTAKTAATIKRSVHDRVSKHWYRAQKETKNWTLCNELRKLSDRNEIEIHILAVAQGKTAGHNEETRLILALSPELNTDLPAQR